ncbi:hypothetical protein [Pseudonocardia nigra]|uniref:hypothetical protein n=1 Tax=Pseudonocardia nigra TaxID=1921578 RepID=UPI001C5DA6CE|nr:hypothetical protein [Pseudonocardia nigra]
MLFLIAFVGAALVALVLWKAMNPGGIEVARVARRPVVRPARPRVSGPDDDPDFLRQLDEKVRRRDEPPSA